MGCIPSRGFSQPATQAEMTLSLSGVDFYDVEMINGFNLPISMTPNVSAQQLDPKQPYFCGAPGSQNPINKLLGSCSWEFTPPSNDYNWVQKGGAACSSNADCSSPAVCGISSNPGKTPRLQKTCGTQLGYWTANQVCGIQKDYGAPFNCQQLLPAPPNETLGELYGCGNVGSCYQNNPASDCCGCVNWAQTGLIVPPAPYTQQCGNSNQSWTTYVEPTLAWIKRACPTAYTYPFDDMSSTFVCSIPQNKLNTVNYTINYCPSMAVPPPPPPPPPPAPAPGFSYMVYVGYPFSPVVINGTITCPDPTTNNPACMVSGLTAGATIVITGSGAHVCNLSVQNDGNVVVNTAQSNTCNVNTNASTMTAAGFIDLPSMF